MNVTLCVIPKYSINRWMNISLTNLKTNKHEANIFTNVNLENNFMTFLSSFAGLRGFTSLWKWGHKLAQISTSGQIWSHCGWVREDIYNHFATKAFLLFVIKWVWTGIVMISHKQTRKSGDLTEFLVTM